jgi:nucleotide-binding universal stress UspA family protein
MAGDLQEAASEASDETLNEARGKLEAAGAVFRTLVRSGQAAETIAQVAREEDIQHIVMGTRGLGHIQGLLLGSVAARNA